MSSYDTGTGSRSADCRSTGTGIELLDVRVPVRTYSACALNRERDPKTIGATADVSTLTHLAGVSRFNTASHALTLSLP